MRAARGFTLAEVLIALSLFSLVLIAIMVVGTSAIRSHFEQIRSGQDASSEVYGIDQMVTTFESTTHLEPCYPPPNPFPAYCIGRVASNPAGSPPGYQEVRGCLNYSAAMGGPLDPGDPNNPTTWFDFCVAPAGGAGPGGASTLFEHYGSGCPAGGGWPTITCGVSCSGGGCGANPQIDASIVNFYPMDSPNSQPVFTREDWAGGIAMQFMVGIATPTDNVPIPVVYNMTTGSGMQKNYSAPQCPAGSGVPCD